MPKKAKSKKQAKFLGAVAGGKIKKKGLSKKKAKEMLKGTKMKGLPEKKKKRKAKPKAKKLSAKPKVVNKVVMSSMPITDKQMRKEMQEAKEKMTR